MDIRQFLAQAPAPSRFSCETRLGCSGLGLEHFREQSQSSITEQPSAVSGRPQNENAPPSIHSKPLVSAHGH